MASRQEEKAHQQHIEEDHYEQQDADEEQEFGITAGTIVGLSPLGNKIPPQILRTRAQIQGFELPVSVATDTLKAAESLGQLEHKEVPAQILQSRANLKGIEIPAFRDTNAASPHASGSVLKYKAGRIGLNIDGTKPKVVMAEPKPANRNVIKHMEKPDPLPMPVLQGVVSEEGSAIRSMQLKPQDAKEPVRKISHQRIPVWTQGNLKILPLVLRVPKAGQPSGLLYCSTRSRAEAVVPRARIQGLPGLRC